MFIAFCFRAMHNQLLCPLFTQNPGCSGGSAHFHYDRCMPARGALRSVMLWVWFLKSPGWFEEKASFMPRWALSIIFIWDGTKWFLLRALISSTVRQLLYCFLSFTYTYTYPEVISERAHQGPHTLTGTLNGPYKHIATFSYSRKCCKN